VPFGFRLVAFSGFKSIREDLDNAIRDNVVADPYCYIRLKGGRVMLLGSHRFALQGQKTTLVPGHFV
jgi:hypothetical protein